MTWGLWSSPPPTGGTDEASSPSQQTNNHGNNQTSEPPHAPPPPAPTAKPTSSGYQPLPPPKLVPLDYMYPEKPAAAAKKKTEPISWNDSLNRLNWDQILETRNVVPPALAVFFAFSFYAFYQSYLRRFPKTGNIHESFFRKRNLLGRVTSVGDGDNFRFFHTPGGMLAGWGWARKVPSGKGELKGRTISVRIAGVDAPETAHFGRPAQPFSAEALTFLREYVLGKRVRAHIYRKDQYERVVATVYVRKPPFFLKKDVGLEMLKRGLATTYEAKTGAEFGGEKMKTVYLAAEATAKKKGKGLWSAQGGGFFGLRKKKEVESPRAFKDRMKVLDVGGTNGNGGGKASK